MQKIAEREIPETTELQNKKLNEFGIYAGEYTLEVEIMKACGEDNDLKTIISDVYDGLTLGGEKQKSNFKNELTQKIFGSVFRKLRQKASGKEDSRNNLQM